MSVETTTATPPPTTNPPTTTAAPEPDNSAIRSLREQNSTLEKALKVEQEAKAAAEARLKELDRAKLDETERLKAEMGDLQAKVKDTDVLRDAAGRYEGKFKSMFEEALAKVPEEHRAKVDTLTQGGDYADRFDRLVAAVGLIPAPAGAVRAGTVTNPAIPNPNPLAPEPPKPLAPKDWGNIDLRDHLSISKKNEPEPGSNVPKTA